ncbi:CYTH domain-containing protein [Microbacterium oleivorans]|uniref:CYTH domain-containing protein n=1 Tax=Microbacterium oleivorans TaxID=273677 RepID=A0A7D5IU28_9MICO|nr:CYTH domain-containing protein [Microbacterium oleivorans]QLD12837.1 CYTH domain-containing protein [Microbacterium oleivorans]
MTTEPRSSIEIERKYDVDAETPLPDWSALPGVAVVGAAEPRALDASYLDTVDGRLAAAGTALRRRTGGPDAGWHIKRTTPEGKHETQWPLDEVVPGQPLHVPEPILRELTAVASPPYEVIARIRNARTAFALLDASGGVVAEFVDDRVTATDVGSGRESSWREWELELGPAAPSPSRIDDFFRAADELVRAVGGVPAASGSKLARALGR